jgi:hypothetical protein
LLVNCFKLFSTSPRPGLLGCLTLQVTYPCSTLWCRVLSSRPRHSLNRCARLYLLLPLHTLQLERVGYAWRLRLHRHALNGCVRALTSHQRVVPLSKPLCALVSTFSLHTLQLERVGYAWRLRLHWHFLRALSAVCAALSALVLWSECVLAVKTNLSPLGLFTQVSAAAAVHSTRHAVVCTGPGKLWRGGEASVPLPFLT